MLISIRSSDLTSNTENSIPLATLVSVFFISISPPVLLNNVYTDLSVFKHGQFTDNNNMFNHNKLETMEKILTETKITYNTGFKPENFYIDNLLSVCAVS